MVDDNKKLIDIYDKFIELAFVSKDVDAMMELMTENTIVVSMLIIFKFCSTNIAIFF